MGVSLTVKMIQCGVYALVFTLHRYVHIIYKDEPVLEILLSSLLQISSRCSLISVAVLLISPKEN